jgi:flagellar hook-basal body complex protein FliE
MNIQRLDALLRTASPWQTAQQQGPQQTEGPSFGEVLARALEAVEQDQIKAQDAAQKLATGEITDIAEVLIASERANLSLGLAVQVRNKLLEAYQEIMRMPL